MKHRPEDEHGTFITVAAWLFAVLGAYSALTSFGQWVLWTFFFPSELAPLDLSLISAISALFGISAFICGIGMSKRRAKALRRSVALLWTYVAWLVVGWVWRIAEFIAEQTESSSKTHESYGYQAESDLFDLVMDVNNAVISVVVCIACVWLARKLSHPSINAAYAA